MPEKLLERFLSGDEVNVLNIDADRLHDVRHRLRERRLNG
jgi:hypothetical protein